MDGTSRSWEFWVKSLGRTGRLQVLACPIGSGRCRNFNLQDSMMSKAARALTIVVSRVALGLEFTY